jgi:hypothetical protein
MRENVWPASQTPDPDAAVTVCSQAIASVARKEPMQAHGTHGEELRMPAFTGVVAAALLVGALGFCVTVQAAFGNKFEKLELHMSTQQVEKALGKADTEARHGDYLIWSYLKRLISGYSDQRADYYVVFRADKVMDFGAGSVKVIDKGGAITIMPIPAN